MIAQNDAPKRAGAVKASIITTLQKVRRSCFGGLRALKDACMYTVWQHTLSSTSTTLRPRVPHPASRPGVLSAPAHRHPRRPRGRCPLPLRRPSFVLVFPYSTNVGTCTCATSAYHAAPAAPSPSSSPPLPVWCFMSCIIGDSDACLPRALS